STLRQRNNKAGESKFPALLYFRRQDLIRAIPDRDSFRASRRASHTTPPSLKQMTQPPSPTLQARIERWPIAGSFTISRGSKTEAVVVVAEVRSGEHSGRGE